MTRAIAYPAANPEEAKARARADANQNGWTLEDSNWHPHHTGRGGVLIVHASELPLSRPEPSPCGDPPVRERG
jgi:hypothetical protein